MSFCKKTVAFEILVEVFAAANA
jgi:hypothetical protein